MVSMKSDVDDNMGIDAGENKKEVACIGFKSDEIRISARKGMKIVVEQGDIYIKNDGKATIESSQDITIKSSSKVKIDSPETEVGGADDNAVLFSFLSNCINQIIQGLNADIRTSPMGPVPPSVSLVPFLQAASEFLNQAKSNTVKIKR